MKKKIIKSICIYIIMILLFQEIYSLNVMAEEIATNESNEALRPKKEEVDVINDGINKVEDEIKQTNPENNMAIEEPTVEVEQGSDQLVVWVHLILRQRKKMFR